MSGAVSSLPYAPSRHTEGELLPYLADREGQVTGVEVFMVIFAMDLIEGLLKRADPFSEKNVFKYIK
jgi:hypothetical protein